MRYTRNFLFNSMHKDWYICQSDNKKKYWRPIVLDFYNGEPDVLDRCTFLLNPIWEGKLMHCKYALGPVEAPEITGQPLPHPPHLVESKPAPPFVLPACLPVCSAGSEGPAGPTGPAAAGPAGPAGATRKTPVGSTGEGTSAVTIPSKPEVSTSSTSRRRK